MMCLAAAGWGGSGARAAQIAVEPGLYDSELGGFRHSDTVAVTEDGMQVLTDYPRDIDSLTLPV